MFKKLTDHDFTDWVAAITGEIGPATETGFELVNASIQVFEKKTRDSDAGAEAKEKTVAEPKSDALARPEKSAEAGEGQPKAEGGVKPKQGKGLLGGVKLR
jgi:hypothetical protein